MQIELITENKKRFLPLLLLGDEQESMIDRYLDRGDLFVLFDGGKPCSLCVVTQEEPGLREIKNLATQEKCQKKGYASALIDHVSALCALSGDDLMLGTGETPKILAFYQRRGFHKSHRVNNFFLIHYDHPIFEEGIQLRDMIYLRKNISKP